MPVSGLYLPPVFTKPTPLSPPQTIISVPVQTALCESRGSGTPEPPVPDQLSEMGSYWPPLLNKKRWLYMSVQLPPHTIISVPVQTAV